MYIYICCCLYCCFACCGGHLGTMNFTSSLPPLSLGTPDTGRFGVHLVSIKINHLITQKPHERRRNNPRALHPH